MKKNIVIGILFVLLAIITYVLVNKHQTKTSQVTQFNFAVEDTAKIDRIFLADTDNSTILLERNKEGIWYVNNEFKAQQEAVHLLLKTFKLIQLKSFVPEPAIPTIVRNLSAKHVKVEIYQGGKKPVKIYYVGHPTQDHQGTYMLLETPELGKSDIPVITEMKAFYGSLYSRFFTDEIKWRFTGVFNYDIPEIQNIEVDMIFEPHNSYRIELEKDGSVRLFDKKENSLVEKFDTLLVKNYVLNYKKIHFEQFNRFLSPTQIDSVKKEIPKYEIAVTNRQGEKNKITIWNKKAPAGEVDEDGNPAKYDRERMYALVNDEHFVLIQTFVFNDLFVPLVAFRKK
jgi:hypothetical protein